MSVQSARVNQIIKGDDVQLTHQIMKDVAYNAELSRAPDMVNTQDIVQFFYPLEDVTAQDLLGYIGSPVGSYPTSEFTVQLPGQVPGSSTQGTKVMQSGLGRTVRAEITRFIASITGDLTINSQLVQNISSLVGLAVGQSIVGPSVPHGTLIQSIDSIANTITLTVQATATQVGETLTVGKKETQYLIDEVDILERGFPNSLTDASGGVAQPQQPLNLP